MTDDQQKITDRIIAEGAITIAQAAQKVPSSTSRGHASAAALLRWILHGKRGVRLEGTLMNGKTWWTSEKALSRFFAALTAKALGQVPVQTETVRQRMSRAEAADRELAEILGD
jgi:ribosomal protein L10